MYVDQIVLRIDHVLDKVIPLQSYDKEIALCRDVTIDSLFLLDACII